MWNACRKWIRCEHRLANSREDLVRLWIERMPNDLDSRMELERLQLLCQIPQLRSRRKKKKANDDCTLPVGRMLGLEPSMPSPSQCRSRPPALTWSRGRGPAQQCTSALVVSLVAELWKWNTANAYGMQQRFRTGLRTETINKIEEIRTEFTYSAGTVSENTSPDLFFKKYVFIIQT